MGGAGWQRGDGGDGGGVERRGEERSGRQAAGWAWGSGNPPLSVRSLFSLTHLRSSCEQSSVVQRRSAELGVVTQRR